jgi:DNA (cytosine-5)-methyltransferase 1
MKFGSVCSGIEAASVAWEPLGWKAAWLSEIEPFPCAVLAHHYPDVPNLGDMTKLPERILSGEVEAPDLFCGGTPCQAFSVAGNRQSLDDARGNLSLTFCEIADAIDSVRTTPAIIFWENVPGVLSTKDNAFGCFLGQLAGEDEPLVPSGGKWSNAGYVYGPKRTIAWRVLDAQYFGVAQRRRRVFVVASAREDFCPATVLFESEGVRRDTPPSRETGKDVAVFTPGSIGGYRQGVGTLRANGGDIGGGSEHLVSQPFELGNTLTARMHKGMNSDCNEGQTPVLQTVFAPAEVDPCMGASGPPYSRTGNERVEAEALAIHNMAVRRLTPVECERLQGFPDEYTNIKDKCPDSPRYKALGNSWAVPVVRWIGERIDALVRF